MPEDLEKALPESVEELKAKLAEAEETLRAIREGEVDAVVVSGEQGEQVYSLVGAESVYRLIVDTMKEAAFTVAFDGTILYANGRFGEFVKQPLEQVVGHDLRQFVAAGDRAAVEAILTQGREQPVRQRLVFTASDGTAVPAHISSSVLDFPDGPSICIVATALTELENSTELIVRLRQQQTALRESEERLREALEDAVAARAKTEEANRELLREIAERKRAEEALRESEAQFRTLANAIPQLCWMANADGWIFWYNDRWYQYTGTTAEQMEGWGWQSVHDPEALLGVLERWKGSIATGEPFDMVFPLRGADGVFRPFLTRVVPVRGAEGRVVRWFGTNTDISEQRRIEEDLRESEAILQSFFDSPGMMRGMVELVGGQIVHVSCNDAAAQIYGIKRDSIAGKTPTDTGATDELTRLWETLYEEARSTGKPVSHEYSRLDAQGRPKWHLTTVSYLGVGRSGNSRFAYTTVDLTDRKRAEEALAQRAQELARSNADLAQFAYVASHDLKEPLRAVSGCVGLLKTHYEGKLDERSNEYMTHIVDGAARMETLIDGLLAFSRVGTQGGELQPVECAKALGTALQNLAASIEESGAVVTHDTLPAVNGDLPQLVSLFQNLIGNALKFRQKAPPRIHVSAERNGRHWHFSVRDNGIGIAPQYFERIFGVFQRLHTRREYPGTGIGLALCKKIVERHGGRIWVESVPGEGATFCFSLLDAQTNHRQHGGEFHA